MSVCSVEIVLILLAGVLGVESKSGPNYSPCGSENMCYTTKIRKISVQVGDEGTDDNVSVEICSDVDVTNCCKTGPLHSVFTDDWSKKDKEEWSGDFLGDCNNRKITVRHGIDLKIFKEGSDRLDVTEVEVETADEDCSNFLSWEFNCQYKATEVFVCGSYQLGTVGGKQRTRQTRVCKTRDYEHEKIKQVVFTMGNDGTNDDVHLELCSDVTQDCCDTVMDSMANDFKSESVEAWSDRDIGDCAQKTLYKIHRGPRVTLWKHGRDTLLVDNVTVITESSGKTFQYRCGDFPLTGDCASPVRFCIEPNHPRVVIYPLPGPAVTRCQLMSSRCQHTVHCIGDTDPQEETAKEITGDKNKTEEVKADGDRKKNQTTKSHVANLTVVRRN